MSVIQQPVRAGADADDEMFDVVNLASRDTGIFGMIFISTAQGAHAPPVKWYPGRPSRDGACLVVTLEDPPGAINLGLAPVEARRAERLVVDWVRLNRAALLAFWNDGLSWTRQEMNSFADGLVRLP